MVKLHSKEPGAPHFLAPSLVKDLVQLVNKFSYDKLIFPTNPIDWVNVSKILKFLDLIKVSPLRL